MTGEIASVCDRSATVVPPVIGVNVPALAVSWYLETSCALMNCAASSRNIRNGRNGERERRLLVQADPCAGLFNGEDDKGGRKVCMKTFMTLKGKG